MSFRFFCFFSKNQFFFLFKIPNMNNQQGIQWGREGYERGRNKKQKQEDYRNALQRQMRERERDLEEEEVEITTRSKRRIPRNNSERLPVDTELRHLK